MKLIVYFLLLIYIYATTSILIRHIILLCFVWLNRSTRESTPSSLIRDSNGISTPGSTTRQRTSSITDQIIRQHIQRNIPTAFEMDEFFACAEKQQQVLFMEKYVISIVLKTQCFKMSSSIYVGKVMEKKKKIR